MNNYLAYIDPGTGSMLLTVVLGILTSLFFVARGLIIKFKVVFSGGNNKDENKNKIPIVIFSDHKRYWNVFKPVCDEMESRGIKGRYWTMSPDDPALEEKYEHVKCEFIGEGNKGFARLNMMNANICLSTTPGLDVLQWKRSKDTNYYVHTYHAVGDGLGYRMFGLDYYDAVLISGENQEKAVRKIEALRNIKAKELELVGSTYMDVMKAKADKLEKRENKETTVLLAPSWGASSILNKYGAEFIQKLVDTGYNIIVRPHPQSKTADKELLEDLQRQFPNGEKFQWNYDNDNFNVLSRSDIMISDFSGVMFDYSFIFDKPIIYADTSLDTSPYDAAWLDEPAWLQRVLPDIGKLLDRNDFDRVKDVIDEVIASDIYKSSREKAKEESWQYRGESAKRTVDYLDRKYKELTEKKQSIQKKQKISKKTAEKAAGEKL